MDKELKFSYRVCECKGGTKLDDSCGPLVRLSSKIVMIGKSVIMFN